MAKLEPEVQTSNPNPLLQKSMNRCIESGCAQQSDHNDDSGCAHHSDHFNDDDDYNLAPSDFDHYQEDLEFENGRTGIEVDTVIDQRDWNTMDMSLRDSNMAGMS